MSNEILFLSGFIIFIVTILLLDLGIFNKKDSAVSLKQAGLMSIFIVLLSLGFYILLTYYGHLIHGIDSIERLQEIVAKHKHPVKIIPNNPVSADTIPATTATPVFIAKSTRSTMFKTPLV